MGAGKDRRAGHQERFADPARQSGLRMTPQRQAILDAVRSSHDHPRAADIYERV